ncbi:MAG: hypothetical protein GWM89_07480 [Candidatus Dadabacteria bacterium]|nr:hypothetical protein [Candidatus Dadabacteria bacterium]NIV43188.1 hypothetical protein [Candidatus Dadabacteria bacterium]NIY22254.1 hypothetical protein [Candidatus Dadabacteria bacterium]
MLINISTAFTDSPNSICKDNPDGIVTEYFTSGREMIELSCKIGRLNGDSNMYYEDGIIKKR